jgi:hypothetical protein
LPWESRKIVEKTFTGQKEHIRLPENEVGSLRMRWEVVVAVDGIVDRNIESLGASSAVDDGPQLINFGRS